MSREIHNIHLIWLINNPDLIGHFLRMAIFSTRVSVDSATATPVGLPCSRTARGLHAGHAMTESSLSLWDGFAEGTIKHDSAYSKILPGYPFF